MDSQQQFDEWLDYLTPDMLDDYWRDQFDRLADYLARVMPLECAEFKAMRSLIPTMYGAMAIEGMPPRDTAEAQPW